MPNLARLALLLLALPVAAQADQLVTLAIQNHTFSPSTFEVPAGERFRIQLTSHDESVDEFESYDMKFEKIIVPGNTITVFAGPLHPGTYTFFDDYHPDQAKGTVTAVAAKE
ncbi:cupredoxin domain-containing protein [Pseudomonas sp. A4002]|uniref:cupredoxin domain-containing protein n=1 Tax=unclassified Pseudomonas TaxID=196821 RepID=UPI0015A3CC95|nr:MULTISPECIES: cupredoxin domain-containing protein [unclassified Pseudomonas]NVZ32985.1 cupredoxin domain-containing protein [Pseudomonas sp. A4002]NWB79968.1 cupredoxin domain-containing protein [Pseudomonas sp. F9001]